MALTQEQKNTISIISHNPYLVLEDFKKRPSYLNSFNNEFFQDGTGLIYKVLSQYFITENYIFLDMYDYIINNSSLHICQQKGHKSNVLSSLFNLKDSIHNFSQKLYNILKLKTITMDNSTYIVDKLISSLYNDGLKNEALDMIQQYAPFISGYRDLLVSVVKNDDISFFNEILKNDLPKQNFNTIDFHSDFITQSPYKNILYYALEQGCENIAGLLLKKFPELISNEKNSTFSQNKKFIPILEAIKNSPSFLIDTLSVMNDHLLSKNFNHLTSDAEKILTYFFNNNYSLKLESIVINLLNANIESYEKNNILKSVFESSIPYENKFYILSCGLEETISEKYASIAIFNSFIFSIQSNPSITQNLFDQFINEFKLRDLISEDQVFNSHYFNNMEYFKIIHNNYLFSTINPLNFVESYIKTINKTLAFTDDQDFIWYKISKLNFQSLSSNKNTFNSLHLMLVNNLDHFVNYFPKESLDFLLSHNLNFSSYQKFKDSHDFYNIINKLVDTSLHFTDPQPFLKLLSFNPPVNLLNKIIKNDNISISLLSQEKTFWTYINQQETFDYCLMHNAVLSDSQHLFSLVNNYSTIPIELYLQNDGDISYYNDKGNILHNLCQHLGALQFEKILLLLDYQPELAVNTNKQNKFPVSYLINDFNKLCKKYNENPLNNHNKKALDQYYNVVKTMFQCGLHSDNKKAFNTLESQLLKYTDISIVFPDLIPILRAEKLSKKLNVKGITIKKNKI